MKLVLASVGRMKAGAEQTLFERYTDRIRPLLKPMGLTGFVSLECSEARMSDAAGRRREEARCLCDRIGLACDGGLVGGSAGRGRRSRQKSVRTGRVTKSGRAVKSGGSDLKLIVLDERGQHFTTRAFADQLVRFRAQETAQLVFVTGGADGIDPDLKARADLLWSLSRLTFPHMLARVILAEQIYRALSLGVGHPYHRD